MQLDFQKSSFLEHSAELHLLGTMKHSNMLVLPKQNFVTDKKWIRPTVTNLGLDSEKASWRGRPQKHFSINQLHTCSKTFSSSGPSNFFFSHIIMQWSEVLSEMEFFINFYGEICLKGIWLKEFLLIFWNGGAWGLRSSENWDSKLWSFDNFESK